MYRSTRGLSIRRPGVADSLSPVMILYMSASSLAASIIVPTYREADNIRPLAERIFAATSNAQIRAELIIVDDHSQDGTEDIVNSLSQEHPIRLIVRRGERGLSSAVLAGFKEAKTDLFVVLDADLQHPPEAIPDLLRELGREDCDFVIGTRYAQGGGIEKDWPWVRRVVSRVAKLLARPLTPLSDPLSGFFAIRRKTWEQAARLDPVGYKIAMELYVKGRCRRPAEVPIQFAARSAGASKLDFAQQMQYLRHLGKLYYFRFAWAVYALIFFGLIVVGAGVLAVVRALWVE